MAASPASVLGAAAKVGRGERGRVTLHTGLPAAPEVWVEENEWGLIVELEPKPWEVVVELQAPRAAPYSPAWILVLGLRRGGWEARAYVAVLPLGRGSGRVTVREALRDDRSYAVGAPSAVKAGAYYYLAYRWRNGDEARGQWLELARSRDGLRGWEVVANFDKSKYGYLSFEQPCIVKGSSDFLYCADTGRGWGIYLVKAGEPEDIELPGEPVIINAKDPAALYEEGRYVVAYSDLNNPGHDLTIVETKDFGEFGVLAKSLVRSQLAAQGNTWAVTHIHAGALVKAGSYYLLFYDALPREPRCFGSGWMGMALSRDLRRWIDLTPKSPLWRGGGIDLTFRYVDVVVEEGNYLLYAEEETTKAGRKDLVAYYAI